MCASGVNGGRPLDNDFYGVLNLFDGGQNIINNINYDYWLPGTPSQPWVYVRLPSPALVREVALTVSPHWDQSLPEKLVLLHRASEKDAFTRVDAVPVEGRQSIELDGLETTMLELIVTFAGAYRVDELEILGKPFAGVDPTPARPHLLERESVDPILAEHLPVVQTAAAIEKEEEERRVAIEKEEEERRVRPAYIESDDTLTVYETLDWESLARSALSDVDLETIGPDEIRARRAETYWGICRCYQVEYDVENVPERLDSFYYYVSSAGIRPAVPVQLRGMAMFKGVGAPESYLRGRARLRDQDRPEPIQRHSGKVVFRVDGELAPGGFIWFSEEPVDFRATPIAEGAFEVYTVDGTTSAYRLLLPDGRQRTRALSTRHIEHVKETVAVYRLRVSTGQDALFLQWAPDTHCKFLCCSHAFTLFDIDDDLATLQSSFYGCDI